MSMFIALCVVTVSQLYLYVQIHQNMYIKYVHILALTYIVSIFNKKF